MKKLLTITFTEAHRGGVTYSVINNPLYYRNGYSLNDDIVKTIIDRVEDFMDEHVPNELIKRNKEIELEVYRLGNLILVIDEITRSKSKRWLDSVYGNFNSVNFSGEDYNFVIAVESKIIRLPISLILNKLGAFIGISESEFDIEKLAVGGKLPDIIFKDSRLYVEKLYLPVIENIYFTETFCAGPKISFYYRDKKIEAEKYSANMLVDKCKLTTKSELSLELDGLLILDLCNLKYSSGSTRTKIDIKIKDSRNL